MGQGAFGVSLKMQTGTATNQTAIADILEAEFPEQERFLADVTSHDSASGYAEYISTGLRALNAFTVTLLWDVDETTHAAIMTAFAAETATNFTIQDPDGDEIIAFAGFVQKVGRIVVMKDGYKAQITIQPTGAPTIT